MQKQNSFVPELITCIPGYLGSPKSSAIEYLYEIKVRGATGMRMFLNSVWALRPGSEYASPYIIKEWLPDTDIAGEVLMPIFEHKWNDDFFYWLEEILGHMKKFDLKLHASLYDFCSWKLPGSHAHDSRTKRWNAWWQFRREYGGFGIMHENTRPFHREWLQKIIPFLDSTGINYDIETINEGWGMRYEHTTEQEAINEFISWHNWVVNELMMLGVPINRIYFSGGERPENINVYSKLLAGYICHHGISNSRTYESMYFGEGYSPPEKRFLSDDGGGYNPDNDGPKGILGKREMGAPSAKWIAEKILENRHPGFEVLSHSVDYVGEDMGCGPYGYLDALEAMGEIFGTIPRPNIWRICEVSEKLANEFCPVVEAYFWPWEEIPPPCDIHKSPDQPKPPVPPKPRKSFWQKLWHWLFGPNSLWKKLWKKKK